MSIQITESTSGIIGGQHLSLTCRIFGAENLNPSVTYRWNKNSNDGQIQVGTNSKILLFTPIRLSDAANYSCTVSIASAYLTNSINAMASWSVRIRSRLFFPHYSQLTIRAIMHAGIVNISCAVPPSSVSLTSNVADSIQIVGSDVLLTCTVELNLAILGSEIFLLTVNAQLSKNGTVLALAGPVVTAGTIFTYTTQLNSFQINDFGNYTCIATIRPQPTSPYLRGAEVLSDTLNLKPCKLVLALHD